uniref:DDE Tnp4 domain-containing protein n=1 Tax=Panagrolaimus davidi TaxID=227884 RepID=A0A914R9P5_9BILA
MGYPNVFNAFNNGQNDALEVLRRLRQLVLRAHTRIQFIHLFDEFLRSRAAKDIRPRRAFFDVQFYDAFGLTTTAAENLLLRVGRHFERPTRTNWALYTPEVLMIALRILRTGCDFWNAGFFIGPSRATAHRGTREQWMHHATVFFNDFGISNVVGAIDGSYIPIRNIGDENLWFCRKGFAAINLTMMVDSCGFIRFISCRWSGRMHDLNVYRNTSLSREVAAGRFEPFPGAVCLGDTAYTGADRFILAHPRTANILPHEQLFWRRHREARSIVERVYGQLKGKYGILSVKNGFMNFQTRRSCSDVIKACCRLFNFSMIQNGLVDDSEDHIYFRDLDPNLTPREDLVNIFIEDQANAN